MKNKTILSENRVNDRRINIVSLGRDDMKTLDSLTDSRMLKLLSKEVKFHRGNGFTPDEIASFIAYLTDKRIKS